MYDSEAHILKYSIIIHGITELYSSVIPYTTGKKNCTSSPNIIIFYKGG